MAKFISGRQSQLNIGVSSSTENKTALQVTGKVGIGTTNADGRSLYVLGDAEVSGVTTATRFSTGPIGSSINITETGITGSDTIIIDPAGVGDNTGAVRIKGDLFVDGTQTIIDSSVVELKDFQIGIASDVSTNVLLDGAGIGIGSTNIRKTLTYDYSSDSLKSSEHFDLDANKTYKINEVEVLRDTQLTIPNAYVSGLGTVTTLSGTNLTYTNADIDNAYVTAGIVTTIAGTNLNYTNGVVDNLYGVTGVVTTLSGTDAFYTYGNFTSADIDNAYVTTGIVTTISGTNLDYSFVTATNSIVTGVSTFVGSTRFDSDVYVTGLSTFVGVGTFQDDLYVGGNLEVSGVSTFIGAVTFKGGTINIGDQDTDDVVIGGEFASNLVPTTGNLYDLGLYNKKWRNIHISNIAGINTAHVVTGIITTLQGTDASYTNAYVNTGIVTTLSGSVSYYTNAYVNTGITTTLAGTNLNYTTAGLTSAFVVSGIVTTLRGTDVSYTNAYVNTGVTTTLAGTNLNYTNGAVDNLYSVTGIITTLQGTDVSYTNAYVNTGVTTTLAGTNLNYTNGVIDNAYILSGVTTSLQATDVGITSAFVVSGIVTTLQGTDVSYTNAYINSGVVTSLQATDVGITSAFVVSGIVTTLQGTDVSYTNAYVNTGVVTTLRGTNLNYTGISTLNQVNATKIDVTQINASGIITASAFHTGALGSSIRVTSDSITGPSTIFIDPATVGNNTGSVRIKGDLYVDGDQFIVNSNTIELADFNIGIGGSISADILLDGAGIGIGSTSVIKSLTYKYTTDSLRSSENIDLDSGKVYKINGTEVLSATQLTVPNSYVSGFGTITTLSGTNLTYTNADIDNAYVTTGIVTTIAGTNLNYTTAGLTSAYVVSGIVTTLQGTDVSYTNAYVNTGVVTTIAGTNLNYTNGVVDNLYGVTGIVTTIAGTNLNYTNGVVDNLYGVTGIVTTIAGTNLNYTTAGLTSAYVVSGVVTSLQATDVGITSAFVVSGIVTTLQGTDVSYTNAYANTGIITTLAGTNLTYTTADIDTAYISVGVATNLSGTDAFYTYGNFTNVDVDNLYAVTGIITTLQGTDASYTNAYVNTGVTTTLAGTNLTYTNADIDNAYVTTGIVTTIQGTDASYTNAYVNTGVTTTLAGTNLNYTNGVVDNLYGVTGIITTLQGTDVSYTNAYVNTGIITTLAGTNLTYTTADIDTAYVTTGIVTTIQGTDASYTNAYVNVGVVTSLTNTHFTSGIATITTIYGDFDGELNSPGNTYYVQTNGNDAHTGDNLNQPFATLAHALSVATSGDTIFIGSGTFTEVFPLTVPVGVTIKGQGGLRGTFIQPTTGTKQNDAFYMNGETTIEDLSVGNFFEPGVGFQFAPGAKTTNRSPYIQRVTVLNKGSATSATDPYGFDTPHTPPTYYKAGRGVYLDGSVQATDTLEAAMLFNECTFICPNNTAMEMTNGARAEWVNCFTYFADKGIYTHDGTVGLGSTGYTRIKTGTVTGSTPAANDELYYLETNSVSGTYNQVGTAITFTKVGHGLTVGDRVFADFTSGTATDGFYYIDTYVDADNFVVTGSSDTTSGNVSYKEALGFGTIRSYDASAGISSFINKGDGLFQLPTERVGKTVTAFGGAAISTGVKKFGTGSLLLDGTGDYAKITSNTDFGFGTGDLTIETFFRPVSIGSSQNILDLRDSAADDSSLHVTLDASNVVIVSYGTTSVITGSTSITTGQWYHVAVSRDSGSTKLFVDGTQDGSTYSDSNDYGVSKPLVIGADYAGTNEFDGYIDEVRISDNARYTTSFTPTTTAFISDGNDKLILHFDGLTGSTSFNDSSTPIQDIRWVRSGVGIATAKSITLADYQKFGGDVRSIGSACVFGNTGITGDGPGCKVRASAFNFSFIGSGKDFSQDISLVNQANEVIELNNGNVFYTSIDQSGDFRVGDAFFVDQETGTVNFGGQDFTLNSLSDLNISDGTNTTIITPTTLTVGNVQLSGNEVVTTTGDLILNPSGISSTRVEGNLTVTGILDLGYSLLGGLDGDKGDITVSTNFTQWTIDANAVTFDKVQNVAGHTIVGRSSSGVGTVEALPVTGSGNVVLADSPTLSNVNVTGVSTLPTLVGTNLNYTTAGLTSAYVVSGVVTTLQATDALVENLFVTSGITTNLSGTISTFTWYDGAVGYIDDFYAVTGIVTTIAGTNLTYSEADIDTAYVTTGIVTTIQGTDASYTNAYVNTGVTTTLAGTNLTYTNADIDNAYVTTGIVTTIAGTNLNYTSGVLDTAYITSGVTTSLQATDVGITSAFVVSGIVTTLQGTDVSYTNAYVNTGVVTTLSGSDVFYTNGNFTSADIDNAYVTTGIVTTLSGNDVFYTNGNFTSADIDNAYITTGIVTTITSSSTQTALLTATSTTTLQGTLGVQNAATFQHNVTINAANKLFSIQNGSAVVKFEVDTDDGNTTIYGTLNTQGAVDLDSSLNVDGAATFNNSVTLSGSNNLTVGGQASVTGNLVVDTDTLYVDSSTDRVGVNQASPGYALDVVGDINSSTAVKVNGVSILDQASGDATALAIALG